MFSRIVFSAALAGLLAGLLWTALEQVWSVPLILEAETYESAVPAEPVSGTDALAEHEPSAWAPADGAERILFTAVGNVVLAIGFGLLLGAIFAMRGRVSWKEGLLWGLGGFAAVNLAPALGLPPELPGTEAAALEMRQLWWVGTVLATGFGLALLILQPRLAFKAAGLVLIVLPHAIGAPHPEVAGGLAPPELERQFIIASLGSNAIAWVVLGGLVAFFFSRFERSSGERLSPIKST